MHNAEPVALQPWLAFRAGRAALPAVLSQLSSNAKGQPELHFQPLHPNLGVSLVQSEVLGLQSVLQTQRGTQHSLRHRSVPGGASSGSEVTLCCATPLSSQSHFGASHLSSLLTIGPGDEG